MSYPNGYQYGQHAGYRAFDSNQQAQQVYQAQYQHPMVVIPSQQPRHEVPEFPASPYTPYSQQQPHPQPGPGPGYYQQSPSQYHTAPQQQQQQSQQFFYPQSQSQVQQQYDSQPFVQQQQPTRRPQEQYHASRPNYSQQAPQFPTPSHHPQPYQPAYQQSPRRTVQSSAPRPTPVRSSPDPLQGPPNVRGAQVSSSHLYNQTHGQYPRPQQRSSQPVRAPSHSTPSQQSPILPQQRSHQPVRATPHSTPSQQSPPISSSQLHNHVHGQHLKPQQRSGHPVRAPSHPHPSQQPSSLPQPPRQRVVAAVEIPSYSSAQSVDQEMARPTKRRRSNEGHAVPVCDAAPQGKLGSQQNPSMAASSPLTELHSSQVPPTPQSSVDYQTVLLSLAEEYINTAYSMSSAIADGTAPDGQHDEYCSLMSTAMACLESVLNNYRQNDPRKEARIRLRLATLLIDECENDEEAEAMLGKGIALCDRSRLADLKYAMQHLSARATFRRSPKAALKSIDKLIVEAEALKLTHWVYAFRLLRVSLGLQLGTNSELAAIAKHLAALSATADEGRHISVRIVAAALEMIVHLRSHSPDAVDLASRAMAAAQTHQLGPEMKAMPQVRGLIDCLDIACSLLNFNADQAFAKVQHMYKRLDGQSRDLSWSKDGSFGVELGQSTNERLEQDTGGIMRRSSDGNAVLDVRWITKNQLHALGYTLSGFTMVLKTVKSPEAGNRKADDFLNDALKMAELKSDIRRCPLHVASTLLDQQRDLSTVMRVYLILAQCVRFEWESARTSIRKLREESDISLSGDTAKLLLYLQALCRQGVGELQAALEIYNSVDLKFEPDSKAIAADKDLRALATLNSVLIRRSLGPQEYNGAERLLATVEPYCLQHSNKAMYAAINLVKATAQDSILKTKQFLHIAVGASKEASNSLLKCILMNIMTSRFFAQAIVGDQAESGAHAARTLAKQDRNKLWVCVADQMYGDIYERSGKVQEAQHARREGESFFDQLPKPVRELVRGRDGPMGLNGQT